MELVEKPTSRRHVLCIYNELVTAISDVRSIGRILRVPDNWPSGTPPEAVRSPDSASLRKNRKRLTKTKPSSWFRGGDSLADERFDQTCL